MVRQERASIAQSRRLHVENPQISEPLQPITGSHGGSATLLANEWGVGQSSGFDVQRLYETV
jgi:hypothetical protein